MAIRARVIDKRDQKKPRKYTKSKWPPKGQAEDHAIAGIADIARDRRHRKNKTGDRGTGD